MEAQPRERQFNRTVGHLTSCTAIKEALFPQKPTFTQLDSPVLFCFFNWKHDIHLHSSLPTTSWIKDGEDRTH